MITSFEIADKYNSTPRVRLLNSFDFKYNLLFIRVLKVDFLGNFQLGSKLPLKFAFPLYQESKVCVEGWYFKVGHG